MTAERTALVLGGSVFIGRRLVEHLLGTGWTVTILNRGLTPVPFGPSVERLIADRTSAPSLVAALTGRRFDAVFDVSGFVMAAGGSDFDALIDLLDGRCDRYVFVSSIMAYEQGREAFPWRESDPSSTDGPRSYGGFKATCERDLLRRHQRSGFPATIARPAAVYGPHNNIFDMETPMFLRLLQRRPILLPHEGLITTSYGHVDDLCRALEIMATHAAAIGEIVNITGDGASALHYVTTLAEVVGQMPDVVFVPGDLHPAPYGHLFGRSHHAVLSTDKATHLLGISPTFDLMTGHRDTFAWFVGQGWDQRTTPLVDPLWRATWDFGLEAEVARSVR